MAIGSPGGNEGKLGENSCDAAGKQPATDETGRRTARALTKTDWLTIRYFVVAEEMAVRAAAKRFGVDPATIRDRMVLENWRDPERIADLPSIEELIVMRNQKEILDALESMSGKLSAALESDDPARVRLAAGKADLVGKTVRSAQSAARAAEVSATTRRKIKANARQPSNCAEDRTALKAELDSIAAKVPT